MTSVLTLARESCVSTASARLALGGHAPLFDEADKYALRIDWFSGEPLEDLSVRWRITETETLNYLVSWHIVHPDYPLWTEEEDVILRQLSNAGASSQEIADELFVRTVPSVASRKQLLGLTRPPAAWSPQELLMLSDPDTELNELCEKLPRRTRSAIRSRRSKQKRQALA